MRLAALFSSTEAWARFASQHALKLFPKIIVPRSHRPLSLIATLFRSDASIFRHHKYPFDYAASEFGVTAQFNPTKMMIDGFAKLGLVTNRKRALGAWSKLKARREQEASGGDKIKAK